jgi:acetyl esterase/lipase
VIATYPEMNTVVKRTKPILGLPVFPASILDDHWKAMRPEKIVTAAFPPARFDITMAIVQQDLKPKFLGNDENIYPFKVLEKSADMPYTLIIHGEDDSAVPVATSIEYTEAARKKFGDVSIDLHVEPGKEHGFDGELPLSTRWLEEKLAKVTELWLGRKDD